MAEKNLNRIKVMLAEKGKTNKWLAEKLGRDQATISKWCTNACQPPLEALIQIAQCLEVDIKELIRVPEHNPYKDCNEKNTSFTLFEFNKKRADKV